MGTKGFTLLEMTLVLWMISIFLLLSPTMMKSSSKLRWDCEKIKDILIEQQAYAIKYKTKREVNVYNDRLVSEDATLYFSRNVTCIPYTVMFNERGNVNMANTISCSYFENSMNIVITLGNGNVSLR